MLAAKRAYGDVYAGAAKKRDTVGESISEELDKIGSSMEESKQNAEDDFDLKELSDKVDKSGEEFNEFMKNFMDRKKTAFPKTSGNLSGMGGVTNPHWKDYYTFPSRGNTAAKSFLNKLF
tara:strand:+ start:204 stop:563 length:360 start_codon:yes stop_codon:yes gene_type:complete